MNYSRELKVGLSLALAALIFFFGVRYFANLPLFGGTYKLYTRFDDAGGLGAGNAVRINGVKVGSVASVELDEQQNDVRVTFSVQGDVTVPEGSEAAIEGIAYLGNVNMAVRLGPASNEPIAPGGYVPSTSTASPISALTDRAPQLLSSADTLLANATSTLEATSTLINNPNSDVRQTLQAVRSAAYSLDRLLQQDEGSLRRTLNNLEAFSGDLRALTAGDSLSLAIHRLNTVLARLTQNLDAIENTTDRLDAVLAKVNQGQGTLGLLVNDATLYRRLDSAALNLNRILEDFETNPERYVKHLDLVRIF